MEKRAENAELREPIVFKKGKEQRSKNKNTEGHRAIPGLIRVFSHIQSTFISFSQYLIESLPSRIDILLYSDNEQTEA